ATVPPGPFDSRLMILLPGWSSIAVANAPVGNTLTSFLFIVSLHETQVAPDTYCFAARAALFSLEGIERRMKASFFFCPCAAMVNNSNTDTTILYIHQ